VDLSVYRYGGAAVGHGVPLYDGADPQTGLPFTYPPFAAMLMVPAALLPMPRVVGLWTAAGVLALAAVLARVLREYDVPVPAARLAAGTGAALAAEPVWSNLSFGQVNLFLMAAILLGVLSPSRTLPGVLVGLAAGVKLTPLVFLVLLALTGRRREAAVGLATFAGTVLLGLVLLPRDAVEYWTSTVWDADRVGGVAYAGNQSVRGVMVRLVGGDPGTLLWLVVAGLLAGGVLLLAAAAWRRGDRPAAVCLGAVSMLLASPISWNHHWVWVVPATVVLWRLASGRERVVVLAAWLAVFCSHAIWWPPHEQDRELTWGLLDHAVGDAYVLAGLAFAGYWLVRSRAGSIRPATSPSAIRPPSVPGAV
jgi:alpha-1,2-mannosyltransferase